MTAKTHQHATAELLDQLGHTGGTLEDPIGLGVADLEADALDRLANQAPRGVAS